MEYLFETGVDEMSWDDLNKNHMPFPAVEDVVKYRKQVYDVIVDLIKTYPELEEGKITMNMKSWAFAMVHFYLIYFK